MRTRRSIGAAVVLAAAMTAGAQQGLAQKYGGVLRAFIRDNPTTLSIHEASATTETWPVAPMYNNLVWFDTLIPREALETVRPELAERWSWRNGNTQLAFKLRQDVRWHDGRPFTSKDVKHTFDVVREVAQQKLKTNPRRQWYFNVKEVLTNGDHEVIFRLGRPQPSLVALLAGGYSPVYPAHIDTAEWRTGATGTGPFKLKEFKRDQAVVLEKNSSYFVFGLPYLDGIYFPVIKARASQTAALIARQVDASNTDISTRPVYEALRKANVGIAFAPTVTNSGVNIILNTQKPPFNNLRLRQAVNLAMDRPAFVRSVYQEGAVPGGAMIPAPAGTWGLAPEQLANLPGFGKPAQNKAEARRLLAEEGYTAASPLRLKLSTRALVTYVDVATWAIGQLKEVGIQAELEQVETATWFSKLARREFTIGANVTAIGVDDPDAVLYETYKCGSQRNYTDYCNREMEQRFDAQSVEFDATKRLAQVHAIDVLLQQEVARPYLAYRVDYFPHYPYVKNWIPHNSTFNGWRMAEVWLDK
ncbi:MAG: ABC transporter substrate-binding protein [Candidatus Lambdaproteobacteria bacterium]|nr:ABC transporter substrate-binding protein [Candidatus Lambdaproteobacteria bacterium]